MHFLHYRASVLILLLPQQDLSPIMLRTVTEIMVYFILQFLHSELGHFDTGKHWRWEISPLPYTFSRSLVYRKFPVASGNLRLQFLDQKTVK